MVDFERRKSVSKRRLDERRKSEAVAGLLELSATEPCTMPLDEPELQHCGGSQCKKFFKTLQDDCQSLREENQLLKERLKSFEVDEESFSGNDEKVKNLTGLPTFALIALFTAIFPFLKANSSITPYKQFILTLIRLRFNVPFVYLCVNFGISASTASRIFNHTINVSS